MMNDQNKSKGVLILELDALRQDLKSLTAQIKTGNFIENEGRTLDEPARSEALYKSILDASPDVITITDLQGNILLTSPRAGEMYGLSQTEDLKGLTVFDFLDEKDHPKAVSMMTKMYEGPQGMVEYQAKRRDGTTFEVEVNSDFIMDSGGKRVSILIILRDISQKKRIEEKLQKSERTYRNLVESIHDVIYEMTLDGTIIYLSPAIEKIAGYTAEELIGTNVFRIVYQEDIPGLLNWLDTSDEKEMRFFDLRFISKEGNLIWVRSLPTNVIENGIIVGRKGIFSDITQQKLAELELSESEKKYRSIFENIQDVYYEIALDGTILEVSPSIELFSKGLYKREEAIGLSMFELYTNKEDREHLHNELRKYGHVTDFEIALKNRDGSILYCLYSAKLVFDQHGNPKKVIGSIHDISERKKAENALMESESRFSQMASSSLTVIWETDATGLYTYVSPIAEQVWGFSPEDLIGKKYFYDLHPAATREMFKKAAINIFSQKEKFNNLVNEVVTSRGKVIWVSTNGVPLLDEHQNLTGYRGADNEITERKLAEEALLISEASLNYAQEIAKMGSWEHSLVTNKLTCSRNYCKVMGLCTWEGDDHLYDRFIQTVVPEDMKFVEYLQQTSSYTENKTEQVDMRIRMPDGSIRWIRNNVTPVFENGQLIALKGVNIDVTEQKLNEEKINHQNERLQAILEAIPDLIFVTARDGTYLEYYSSESDRLIVPDHQIIGKNIKELFNKETAILHLQKIDECLEQQAIVTYEFSGATSNEEKFFEVRLAPLGSNRVLTVARDITEKKKNEEILRNSEEKYRYMFFNNPQPMWIYDMESLAFLEVNTAAVNHYGYSREEFLSMNLKDIRPAEDIDDLLKDIVNTKKSLNTAGEWRHLKKNGEIIHVEIVSHSVKFNGRNARHILVNDITRRKQVEQEITDLNANLEIKIKERTVQLEETNNNLLDEIEVRKQIEVEIIKARSEAEQANMAKSEFLSRMSHELRTPMNSILGFAQLLQMGQLQPGQLKGVNHIVQSGKHLLILINEVLDISRIEAGHLTLSLEPVLLSGAINETISILKPLCYDRQIKLEQSYFPDNKIYVNSDHQRLKQILLNLLNNAVKYNRQAGTILIKVEKKLPDPNSKVTIRISITDTGFGISEEDIPKLFKPFERIGAEKTVTEGTGLGLAVVKKLLDAMGGMIGIKSQLGIGSTFWIELPHIESQRELINNNGNLANFDSEGNTRTGTILYIEDNSSNLDLVEQILLNHRPGLHLISDMYGNSAVSLVILHQPDLILLDLDLPDVHGSEVLKLLKGNEKTSHIPVVIVSADAMSHQLDRLMKMGAAYYLTKPLDVIEFLQIIDKFAILKNNVPNNT